MAQPLEGFEGWMIGAFWQDSGAVVAPFQVPSRMTPLLVTDTEVFWQPEPWFVVVLTVTVPFSSWVWAGSQLAPAAVGFLSLKAACLPPSLDL